MQRKIRFTRKVIDNLPPCPAESKSSEVEYTSLEAPPGLRLVITKRGHKSWLLRYTIKTAGNQVGIKRAIKLGDIYSMEPAEACRQAQALRTKIAQGIDPLNEREIRDDQPTLNQFFSNEYLPHVQTTLRSAKDVESRWRLHLSPVFGGLRFSELRTAAILQFHDRKRMETCAATANRLLALLKRLINVAIMLERCERNVTRGIRMHAENNIRQRTLAGDELRRFLAALAEEPNRVAADFFLFSLATGARREESLQLTWGEINKEERIWRIPAHRSKSGKSRIIPLNEVAMTVLEQRPKIIGNNYVFPGKICSGKVEKHLVNPTKAFRRVLAKAGIADVKIHDLRRSTATLLINNGGSMSEACNLLGHSSSTITATRYAFVADARVREASQRVSAVLTEASGGRAG